MAQGGYGSGGAHADIKRVLRGLKNGADYAVKIRLPHAIVMTLLFKKGSPRELLRRVLRITVEHARNLALFVGSYKAFLFVIQRSASLLVPPVPRAWPAAARDTAPFAAGALAASIAWTEPSAVNVQIALYLLSRVLVSAARIVYKRWREKHAAGATGGASGLYRLSVALLWGAAMWQFEHHPETLQRSLRSSMRFLYRDSNRWAGARDFLPSPSTAATVFALFVLERSARS